MNITIVGNVQGSVPLDSLAPLSKGFDCFPRIQDEHFSLLSFSRHVTVPLFLPTNRPTDMVMFHGCRLHIPGKIYFRLSRSYFRDLVRTTQQLQLRRSSTLPRVFQIRGEAHNIQMTIFISSQQRIIPVHKICTVRRTLVLLLISRRFLAPSIPDIKHCT